MISYVIYLILFFGTFWLDRITKYFAINYLDKEYKLNNFISFDLVLNRGISWGILNSGNNIAFIIVTISIVIITGLLIAYAYKKNELNHTIIAEILIISGSISNIIDRIFYGGVIDFIIIWIGSWPFPVFNFADCAIVIGIIYMFYEIIYKNEISKVY